jgi:DNA-binding CsgD family transcriptional regulator/energy-converting hydrogenase Eha subunit B
MTNPGPSELSERELEILRLVATGAGNKEIAQRLYISSNTVKVHLRNIFTKIGAASRTEAAMYAVRIGLVKTEARQVANEDDTSAADEAQLFSMPIEVTPDAEDKSTQAHSPLRWIFIAGVVIIILTLAGIGIVLVRDGSLAATPSSLPPTATPIEQWHALADLPTPRSGLATVGYENQVYAIAGETASGLTGVVERYDPETDTWVTLAPKPLAVADAGAAVIGGQIYVPGGRLASGLPTDSMEVFDPLQNTWVAGTALPRAISAYAMVAYEGRLFLFGGWDGERYLDTVYIYTPDRNTWAEGPTMPTPRAYAGAVTAGNKIYVLGGTDGQQALTANDVYQPNLDSQPWSQATPLPVGRYAMGVANIADITYIIGGQGSEPALAGLAYQQNKWGLIETPLLQSWTSLSMATLGTRLYVLGGTTAEGLSNQAWSYQAIFTITLPIVR